LTIIVEANKAFSSQGVSREEIMADREEEEGVGNDEEVDDGGGKLSKEKERESKGVSAVTDFVQENEGDMDKAQAALEAMAISAAAAEAAAALFTGTLAPEDLTLISEECELTKEAAEQLLRKNNGEVEKALRYFINNQ